MSFIELPPGRANRLINHGPTVLVTGGHGHQANIMTAAWIMPASHTPPMLAVAIGPTRHSHQLIIEGGEFGVNIPAAGLLEAVWTCGTTSGRKGNKFELCGLTPYPGKQMVTPLIAECLGAIECRLVSHPVAGDHTIMIGEVLTVWVQPDFFDERLLVEKEGAHTLHHLGGRDFCLPGPLICKG
jgi:flavin reductase (DIM6/NTAB) family NADH-FMN oxidoreductase RutF